MKAIETEFDVRDIKYDLLNEIVNIYNSAISLDVKTRALRALSETASIINTDDESFLINYAHIIKTTFNE